MELPAELRDGCVGEWECCGNDTGCCGGESDDDRPALRNMPGGESNSSESEVVVVRLVPDPLRMRALPLKGRGPLLLDIRGGGTIVCALHSFPR